MGKRVSALLAAEFSSRARLIAEVGRNHSTEGLLDCEVIIDFSSPDAAVNLASKILSAKKGPSFVVASTGWQPHQIKILEEAARYVPVLASANFSLGVMAFMEILKTAAPLLDSLGYKPVLIETHHQHKKDAPSGTALAFQRVWKQATERAGGKEIETHSIRAGEVVGDHRISFYGPSDLICLEHSARNRDIFAHGAIEAALWLAGRRAKDPTFHGIVPIESFFSDFNRVKASI